MDHYMKVSGGSKAMDHYMKMSGGSKAMGHYMKVSGGSKAMDHYMKVSGGSKVIPEIPADITFPLNSVAEVDALEEMFVDLRLQECIVSAT